MSQPNDNGYNPSFSFNINGEPYLDPQPTHMNYNATFSQWSQGTLGSISSPSPSPTAMSVSAMEINPGYLNGEGVGRSPSLQQQNNSFDISTHTSHLAPPPIRSRSSLENANPNLILNDVFSSSDAYDEPWSTVRMRNSGSSTQNRSPFVQTNYGHYRERGPSSDIDSGPPHSDSGYFTHQAHSVRSHEPERVDQELPAGMTYGVNNLTMSLGGASVTSEPTEIAAMMPSDQTSQYSGRSTHSKALPICEYCSETFKCPSDHKKHMLKHRKPHVCDIPNCRRASRGFTTKNDLDRHKKSVHRVGVEKDSYQCASEHCRNKGKIWPRLDNFKQHIARLHRDEDEQDLIRRSSYQEVYPPGDIPVAPLDTTLAGMGAEKHFGNNKLDDPASAISLTSDQESDDCHGWRSLGGINQHVDRKNPDTLNLKSSASSSQQKQQQHRHHHREPSKEAGEKRQNSLSMLAEAAGHMGKSAKQPLSSAPQTKADQQRQALQKFSKAIVGEIHSASADVDLQDVVMRILSGVTNLSQGPAMFSDSSGPGVSSAMTKSEALKASQAISSLIKQTSVPQPRNSKTASTNGQKCDKCSTILARSCDMKKHMKRHTKPYGCTFANCYKRFGAKSDWKRHENSQHFQVETYLCHRPRPSLTPATSTPELCNKLFYNEKLFEQHLSHSHKIDSDDRIQKEVNSRRIGKNGQGQFWCGFCKQIIKLKETRNAAWDERFDHIDGHFSKEVQSIDEWICLEASRPKGELRKEYESRMDPDETEESDVKRSESEESSPDPSPNYEDAGEGPSQPSHEAPSALSMLFPEMAAERVMPAQKKRHMIPDDSMADSQPKRSKTDGFSRYCCNCQNGPWPIQTYTNCLTCNHCMCDCAYCDVVDVTEAFDGGMMMQCIR